MKVSVSRLVTSLLILGGYSVSGLADPSELIPKVIHPTNAASKSGGSTSSGIVYHGGPVMLGTPNIYYIWYGNWSGNTATTILENFAKYLGGSSYLNINTTYYDGSSQHVSNWIQFQGSITDNYSHGTTLTDANIQQIVLSAINGTDLAHQSAQLPMDANGIYFVLTSADVKESSGFCTKYCGWHTYTSTAAGAVKYAFVGNPDQCPSACEAQTVGPNGNAGADGMASIVAHESEEAITDPQLNAWYDRRGNENADKCAWTFGTTSTAANGAKYNITLSDGSQYLIQRNWVNASGGYCAMSY